MKKLLLVFGLFVLANSCSTVPKPTIATNQDSILVNSAEVASLVRASTVVVDARPSYVANGVAIPGSRRLNASDLGLKKAFVLNDFQDIKGVLRRQGIDQKTPVVIVGDKDRDASDMGYIGLIMNSLGVEKIDVADIKPWRQRPREDQNGQIPQLLTSNLLDQSLEIEMDRTVFTQECTMEKCICVSQGFDQIPRRFIAQCEIKEVSSNEFWSSERTFNFLADQELQKKGISHQKLIIVPWSKENYFTAWALQRFGYKVRVVRTSASSKTN